MHKFANVLRELNNRKLHLEKEMEPLVKYVDLERQHKEVSAAIAVLEGAGKGPSQSELETFLRDIPKEARGN